MFFEKQTSTKEIFRGKIVSLRVDEVELPDGKIAKREVVSHSGGVCILPIDNAGNCYFVRQFRYPFDKVLLELPAGKLEKGEDPKESAIRELREEIGAVSGEVTDLGKFIPTCAYLDEVIHCYMAQDLSFVGQKLDEGEFLEVIKIKLKDAVQMVLRGEIEDGKTQAVLLKAALILKQGV